MPSSASYLLPNSAHLKTGGFCPLGDSLQDDREGMANTLGAGCDFRMQWRKMASYLLNDDAFFLTFELSSGAYHGAVHLFSLVLSASVLLRRSLLSCFFVSRGERVFLLV